MPIYSYTHPGSCQEYDPHICRTWLYDTIHPGSCQEYRTYCNQARQSAVEGPTSTMLIVPVAEERDAPSTALMGGGVGSGLGLGLGLDMYDFR